MLIRIQFPQLRIADVLRVLALLGFVQLVALGLWIGSAHARARESLLSIGAELMRIEGARASDPARSLFVNGVTVHLRAATTDQDLHAVLDRFHELCRERAGVEAPQAVVDKLRRSSAHAGRGPSPLDGILRSESGSVGALACIDTGTRLSMSELISRLRDFANTGDLSAVGDLRYVLAHRVDGKTAVLTMWTEGSTPLLKMFPSVGDAPGEDPPGVPRPPGTRRVLSSWENGQPYSLGIYVASDSLESLRTFYAQALTKDGWTLEPAAPAAVGSSARSFVARRGKQTTLVRVAPDSHGQPAISVALLD